MWEGGAELCRLTPLDKNPGLKPIRFVAGIRRIIEKVVTSCFRSDIINTNGNLQLGPGIRSGCEIAVHASIDMFEEEKNHGILKKTHQMQSIV